MRLATSATSRAILLTLFILQSLIDARQPPLHHLRNRAAALASTRGVIPAAIRSRHKRTVSSWSTPPHLGSTPPYIIYPGDFGADPSGRTDSTASFQAALAALLSRNTSSHEDEGGTTDLGGALLDLEGGDYLISAPLIIPSNYSNCAIVHGSLRASPAFPQDSFLVEIGSANSPCVNWGDSCNEDVSIEDIFFDGQQVAAGCVRFWNVIGVNAGPDLFCVNFTTTGFDIEGGHEVELHESWVGACWYTPPSSCWLNSSALGSTTGILINGNDHILDNVVVFAGLVGVAVRGAANLVTATHTWNTQSGAVPAGIGIDVSVWQNRFVSPYLDYVPLVCRGCALTVITDGFFLGGAQIIFEPDPNAYPVRGVFISGSVYAGLGDGVPDIIALPPPKNGANFSGVQDVTILGSTSDNALSIKRSVSASLTVSGASPWTFDFSGMLIFETLPIVSVSYSVTSLDGTFCRYHALPPVEHVVTIVADANTNATVVCTVDQSVRLPAAVPGASTRRR